jgi:hypothetical protein
MKRKTIKKHQFNGFGFPIILYNVPMRLVLGEWCYDFKMNELQRSVLFMLCRKSAPLTGAEVRFIRKYLELTKADFAKVGGVTHAAVAKWEGYEDNDAKMSPATEMCIRLFVLEKLFPKNKDFIQHYRMLLSRQIQGIQSKKETLEIDIHDELSTGTNG